MDEGAGVGEAAGDSPPGPPGLLGQLLLLLLLPVAQLANWPWRRASAGDGEDGSGDRILAAHAGGRLLDELALDGFQQAEA